MKRLILILLLCQCSIYAERLHTYVDENGVKVITNLGSSRTGLSKKSSVEERFDQNRNFIPIIGKISDQYGISSDLVEAIVKVESGFDPLAVSVKDCKGLMQLHPDTVKRFGVSDVFDPEENIEGGVKFLKHLMGRFPDNLDHVLAAYNAGENAVLRHKGIPPYRETRNYVKKVRALYNPVSREEALALRRKLNRKIIRVVDTSGEILLTNIPASR
jgi:hypothetical protein